MKSAFFIRGYGTIEQRLWLQTQGSNSSPFTDEPWCSAYLVLCCLRSARLQEHVQAKMYKGSNSIKVCFSRISSSSGVPSHQVALLHVVTQGPKLLPFSTLAWGLVAVCIQADGGRAQRRGTAVLQLLFIIK